MASTSKADPAKGDAADVNVGASTSAKADTSTSAAADGPAADGATADGAANAAVQASSSKEGVVSLKSIASSGSSLSSFSSYHVTTPHAYIPCCCFARCCDFVILNLAVAIIEILLSIPWFWAVHHIRILISTLKGNHNSKFQLITNDQLGFFGQIGICLGDNLQGKTAIEIRDEFEVVRKLMILCGFLILTTGVLVIAATICEHYLLQIKVDDGKWKNWKKVPSIGCYVSILYMVLYIISMIATLIVLMQLFARIETEYDKSSRLRSRKIEPKSYYEFKDIKEQKGAIYVTPIVIVVLEFVLCSYFATCTYFYSVFLRPLY